MRKVSFESQHIVINQSPMEAFKQQISPVLWFDDQAEEAARFYTSTFPNSRVGRSSRYGKAGFEIHGQPEGKLMTLEFLLDGQKFTALNGGREFNINPSISFITIYHDDKTIERIWNSLSQGGSILMPLDQYPWSLKYGWIRDRYGVSWQITLGQRDDVGGQSIITSFLFVNDRHGQAEEAINYYTSIFRNSKISAIMRYGNDRAPEKEGTVMYSQFSLEGQAFSAIDSAMDHHFGFTEAISLMVACDTQEEIDYYWNRLSEGGDPKAQMCGWLKDKFGVSWQVVPNVLHEMLQDPDQGKVDSVTLAYLKMKKFDIEELKRAFDRRSEMAL